MAKPKQRSNPSLENNYNTASDNNNFKRCKHFYSILSCDFREDEFLSEDRPETVVELCFCNAVSPIEDRNSNDLSNWQRFLVEL